MWISVYGVLYGGLDILKDIVVEPYLFYLRNFIAIQKIMIVNIFGLPLEDRRIVLCYLGLRYGSIR